MTTPTTGPTTGPTNVPTTVPATASATVLTTESAKAPFDFGRVVAGLVLVALGAVWLADVTEVVELRAGMVLPALLAAVGVALMVGSLQGSHPTLVTVGVLLAVATVFSALSPPEALRGGIGERTYTVTSAADLESDYQVALGDLTLDLSGLALTGERTVSLSVGAGDLVVVVPPGVPVQVEASVGAGEIHLFGESANGVAVRRTVERESVATGAGSLTLDLEVGAGRIEVRR